jgi:hypothetical protein
MRTLSSKTYRIMVLWWRWTTVSPMLGGSPLSRRGIWTSVPRVLWWGLRILASAPRVLWWGCRILSLARSLRLTRRCRILTTAFSCRWTLCVVSALAGMILGLVGRTGWIRAHVWKLHLQMQEPDGNVARDQGVSGAKAWE